MSDQYCLCRGPDDGEFMLQCHECHLWCHGKCVYQYRNRKNLEWVCPLCCNKLAGQWIKVKKAAQSNSPLKVSPLKKCSKAAMEANKTREPTFEQTTLEVASLSTVMNQKSVLPPSPCKVSPLHKESMRTSMVKKKQEPAFKETTLDVASSSTLMKKKPVLRQSPFKVSLIEGETESTTLVKKNLGLAFEEATLDVASSSTLMKKKPVLRQNPFKVFPIERETENTLLAKENLGLALKETISHEASSSTLMKEKSVRRQSPCKVSPLKKNSKGTLKAKESKGPTFTEAPVEVASLLTVMNKIPVPPSSPFKVSPIEKETERTTLVKKDEGPACNETTFSAISSTAIMEERPIVKKKRSLSLKLKVQTTPQCKTGVSSSSMHDSKSLKRTKDLNVSTCSFSDEEIDDDLSANQARRLPGEAKCGSLKASIQCSNCKSTFTRKSTLTAHLKSCSESSPAIRHLKSCTFTGTSNCTFKYRFKSSYTHHLKEAHNCDIKEPIVKKFSNMEEFLLWKEEEEDRSHSFFSQQWGERKNRRIYYCQQDGTSKPHKTRKTSKTSSKGRMKTGAFCPARIHVKIQDDNAVSMLYMPTHSHILQTGDIKNHPLPPLAVKLVNDYLAHEAPPRSIKKVLMGRAFTRGHRKGNMRSKWTRRIYHKIGSIRERKRRLALKNRLNQEDSTAVKLKVELLRSEPYDPILIFKPYQQDLEIGPTGTKMHKDSFMLGIQTEEQKDMMLEGASRIVAVDDTHGCTQYGFKLLNVVVPDEFNRGYPVAHLITNKMDADHLQYFFAALKNRCPNVNINCVITDDDPAIINSMNAGFKEDLWHILCKWHFHRTLQKQLRARCHTETLINELYQALCVIIEAKTPQSFKELTDSFKINYKTKAKSFINYFTDKCLPRAHKWAMCFRQKYHSHVDTTMLVESFHNVLKTTYLKRKPNKRVDDLLDILMEMENDYNLRLTTLRDLTTSRDVNKAEITDSHNKGMKIPDDDVIEVFQGFWRVKAQSKKGRGDTDLEEDDHPDDPDDVLLLENNSSTSVKTINFNESSCYNVIKTSDSCFYDHCYIKCISRSCSGLCPHMYMCSCPHEVPLCKHIHKVYSMVVRECEGSPKATTTPETPSSMEFHAAPVHPSSDEDNSAVLQRQDKRLRAKISATLSKISEMLSEENVNSVLPHISFSLDTIVAECEAASNAQSVAAPTPMVTTEKFTPAGKLQKQAVAFKKIKKKDVVKKKDLCQYPSYAVRQKIRENLLRVKDEKNAQSQSIAPSVEIQGSGFTPPLSFINDVTYSILKLNDLHEISLLSLKSLEPVLTSNEIAILKKKGVVGSKFTQGWLHCDIVDAFFKATEEAHEDVFSLSSQTALSIHLKRQNFRNLYARAALRKVLLFPANLTGNHWVAVGVLKEHNLILAYDPLGVGYEGVLKALVENILVDFLPRVFPSVSIHSWRVEIHDDQQNNATDCGVKICWFAQKISEGIVPPLPSLSDCVSFRLTIYKTIVGDCLQRKYFFSMTCGMCGLDATHVGLNQKIKCKKCSAVFHSECVQSEVNFVCPPKL